MKYILIIIALIGVAWIFSSKRTPNTHICSLDNANLITIGDSLANGFGVSESDSFAVQTARILRKNPIKLGIDGETTSELLGRISGALSAYNSVAGVIISIGGNDFLRQNTPESVQANLDNIVRIAKRHTNCVVLLGVPSGVVSTIFGGISPIYSEIATKHNVLLDDTSMPKILNDINLKIDQIHPNKDGHGIIARNLANLIMTNR